MKSSSQKAKLPPVGLGGRFSALKNKLGTQPGIVNPGALAASIGRKKYGKKKFNNLAKLGKKKKKVMVQA